MGWFRRLTAFLRCSQCDGWFHGAYTHCTRHPEARVLSPPFEPWCIICMEEDEHRRREETVVRELAIEDQLADKIAARVVARLEAK